DTCGRNWSSIAGVSPRPPRSALIAASMSGALSSSVPSRSNSTRRGKAAATARPPDPLFAIPGSRLQCACEVVHLGAPREPRCVAPRLVHQAAHVLELQAGLAQPAAELGRLDEV